MNAVFLFFALDAVSAIKIVEHLGINGKKNVDKILALRLFWPIDTYCKDQNIWWKFIHSEGTETTESWEIWRIHMLWGLFCVLFCHAYVDYKNIQLDLSYSTFLV